MSSPVIREYKLLLPVISKPNNQSHEGNSPLYLHSQMNTIQGGYLVKLFGY